MKVDIKQILLNVAYANEKGDQAGRDEQPESGTNQDSAGGNEEFVSESFDHETINDDEIKNDLAQLKLDTNKKDDGKFNQLETGIFN